MVSYSIIRETRFSKKRSHILKMADPYPAVGSNYRPPIEPSTTNRGLTLTAEQVVALRDILSHIPDPSKEVVELYDKVKLL